MVNAARALAGVGPSGNSPRATWSAMPQSVPWSRSSPLPARGSARRNPGPSAVVAGYSTTRVPPMWYGVEARTRSFPFGPTSGLRWLLPAALLLLVSAGADAASRPVVARPTVPGGKSAIDMPGVVFFLATSAPHGVAAVGTAHTIPVATLARAGRVDFYTGRSLRRVATSHRFLAEPGRPFSAPGATLRDDFLVYGLDAAPLGVQVLRASTSPPQLRSRVRVIGLPAGGPHDRESLLGWVAAVAEDRLEVDLDHHHDLRGWGGAPIVDGRTGQVIGLLEAHVPQGNTSRVFAAPISGVLEALEAPLDQGEGRALTAFVGHDSYALPAARAEDIAPSHLDAPRDGERHEPPTPAQMEMGIEYPPPNSRVASSVCGVFVAGHATAFRGDMRRFDVVIVIDTSRSTGDPAGTDINDNGIVGAQRLGRLGSLFASGSTDPGDTILAAEVAAARKLLEGFDARNTRVGIVSFAGDPPNYRRNRRSAFTLEPLTTDYDRIQAALDGVLASEPEGNTDMAAGVDRSTFELLGMQGAASTPESGREKIVFFFTDGQPTLPYGEAAEADNVRAVLRAANRAARYGVRVHTFAIGPDALEGPIAMVELASRTEGYFTPVRDPGDLENVVEEASFANLDALTLRNHTSDKPANYLRTTLDGSWAALVPMDPGKNRVRAWARADDGAEIAQLRSVVLDPEAEAPALTASLAARRNRLLEDCLRDLKRKRQTAEQSHIEQVRQDLLLEIEQERAKARNRADEQRKELQLEGDLD